MLCILFSVLTYIYLLYDGLTLYLKFIIVEHRSSKMAASSSSQSKRKNRLIGPIHIDGDGCPFGPHCDGFSPTLTWPEHCDKLVVSCVMFY